MKMIDKVRSWTAFKMGFKRFGEMVNPFRKIDPDESQWTSISGQANRDLSSYDHRYISDIAYYKWLTDPLAARIIEIIADFVIGDGVTVKASDPDVQKVLDDFWYDEVNDMPNEQSSMVQEKQIFGEQLILPFVNPVNGLVQLSRIDPTWIQDVKPMAKFPQKADIVSLRKSNITGADGLPVNELKVIRTDTDPTSPTAGFKAGDCFYFTMNKIAGKRRGHSQLLRSHEMIEVYGTRLFNEAERQELMNNYVWDVTLTGASDEQIKKYAQENPRPNPGTVRFHGDKVKWDVIAPDLKSTDFTNSNRQFLQVILGTYGLPEHYFALGGEVNYATAKAMSEPTLRMFKRLQRATKNDFEVLCDYQIEKAYQKRRIASPTAEYEVCVDEINTVDLANMATAISQLVTSLQAAEVQGWIAKQDAAKAFESVAMQAGIDVEAIDGDEPPPQGLVNVANAFQAALEARKKKKGNG